MEPPVSPPWRSLEVTSEAAPSPATASVPSEPARWRDPAIVRAVAVVGAAAIVAILAFALAATSGSGSGVAIDVVASDDPFTSIEPSTVSGEIVVEVVGAVGRPGVVRLPAGSRVADVIEAAGGFGPRVDTARAAAELHLATVLADGDRVVVPSRDDPAQAAASAAAGPAGAALIDLNQATLEQLDTLPGVGPVTAQKILDARAEAPFASVDDLRSRGVLGEKTFENLRELVTVP
jgi:competence protein ComEA